jgi:hypothetical protein
MYVLDIWNERKSGKDQNDEYERNRRVEEE